MSLYDDLAADPRSFHLFHALRIIEAHHRDDAPRLGESRHPAQDPIRLTQDVELSFPNSTITSFRPPSDGRPGQLANLAFGFFGPQGPLPLHLTEYVRDRLLNHRDPTIKAFADMLTHRHMSLIYRAWATAEPAVNYDRGLDPFAEQIAALAGVRGVAFSGRDHLPDVLRRFFAGHLGMAQPTPEGLVAILSDFFDAPVGLEEFVGTWLELDPGDRWELGVPSALGRDTSIGARVWARGAKFRVRLGPLDRATYERLLPGGESLKRLRDVVRAYVGDSLEYDVNLVLAGDEVPRAVLGGRTRLGQTGWMRARAQDDTPPPDADDLYLNPAQF